jgi:hypothetical protein
MRNGAHWTIDQQNVGDTARFSAARGRAGWAAPDQHIDLAA